MSAAEASFAGVDVAWASRNLGAMGQLIEADDADGASAAVVLASAGADDIMVWLEIR